MAEEIIANDVAFADRHITAVERYNRASGWSNFWLREPLIRIGGFSIWASIHLRELMVGVAYCSLGNWSEHHIYLGPLQFKVILYDQN